MAQDPTASRSAVACVTCALLVGCAQESARQAPPKALPTAVLAAPPAAQHLPAQDKNGDTLEFHTANCLAPRSRTDWLRLAVAGKTLVSSTGEASWKSSDAGKTWEPIHFLQHPVTIDGEVWAFERRLNPHGPSTAGLLFQPLDDSTWSTFNVLKVKGRYPRG